MKAPAHLTQISFSVPSIVAQNLVKRAGPLNIRATEYARRLFEAAYSARIAQERGETTADAVLDRAVRDVFLLADCEPEYIAEAISAPVEWVRKILEGWRRTAGGMAQARPPAKPAPETPAQPVPPPAGSKAWPPETVEKATALWAEGKTCSEIGAAIGKKEGAVSVFMSKNRSLFPKRKAA